MQMKMLFAAVLAFAFSSTAQGSIIAQLQNSSQTGSSGSLLVYNVTLTNSSATDQVWLNGISSTASSPFVSIDTTPFDANAPLFLDPLASSGPFELFSVSIAPGTPAGPYIGSIVSLIGGADGGNGTALNDLVDISFDVDVTPVATTAPEPGTFALLGMAMVVAVFARGWKRRNAARGALLLSVMLASMQAAAIKTVHFMSEDHTTRLVAYMFEPAGPAPHPAIVLLHGRAGPYSSAANGVYNAATLSQRHQKWGNFWAERGYYALLVDSFGPRNYPKGFPAGSYKDRPPELSEQTVRPLDAYGALRYLRTHNSVMGDRIGVQGWSNGAMTVLATLSDHAPGRVDPGFRAALAEYPGCGMDAVKGEYHSYAPLLMLLAGNDEEVNPKICEHFAERAKAAGSALEVHLYPGAGHNYDDPGKSHQSVSANHMAAEDTFRRAQAFFAAHLSQ